MRTTRRVAALLTGLASLCAMASSAGAATWHNSGDTAFTAAAGAITLNVTSVSIACTGGSVTGTAFSGSKAGNSVDVGTATETYSTCPISGIPASLTCSTTATATQATGTATVSETFHRLCSFSQFGAEICKIEGQVTGTYHNPIPPSTNGSWTLPASTSLRATDGSAGTCFFGVGEPLSLPAQTITITSATGGPSPHLGPVITRTA